MRFERIFVITLLLLAIPSLRIQCAEVAEAVLSTTGDVSAVDNNDSSISSATMNTNSATKLSSNDEKVTTASDTINAETATAASSSSTSNDVHEEKVEVPTSEIQQQQSRPLIDIFGTTLLSLEMVDNKSAMLKQHNTSDALKNKKVIGLYFSADWCGPCRKFTPELVSFYEKINKKRKNSFEIVWISRCRDVNTYGQYFTQMGGWYALPPNEAMGKRGQLLGELYKVKGIPSLVLIDEDGNTITTDARNKIPQDKAGIGFPWRNPLVTLYITILPKSLRHLLKSQIIFITKTIVSKVKVSLGLK